MRATLLLPSAVGLAACLAITVAAQPQRSPVAFTDVTSRSGVTFRHTSGAFGQKYLPETMGAGVVVLDFDNDGRQDLFFVNGKPWPGRPPARSVPALYRNG